MVLSALPGEGIVLKGALHVHTTNSDGACAPEKVAAVYAANGYDFMAFTDHNYFTWLGPQCEGMIMLPGVEYNTAVAEKGTMYNHVVAIYPPENAQKYTNPLRLFEETPGREQTQRMIDAVKAEGAYAIYAHPTWSYCDPRELIELQNYDAIEVYNHLSDLDHDHGKNESFCDMLFWLGKRFAMAATDDTHQRGALIEARSLDNPDPDYDIGGGYIMLKAKEKSAEAIFDTLQKGHYYATNGPELHSFTIEDGYAKVACSPARAVHIKGYPQQGISMHGTDITEATIKLPENNNAYYRCVVEDAEGYRAWSQLICL